jgi:hypothetical protein
MATTQSAKSLTVDMSYSEPRFTFNGIWTGHDVRTVSTLIRREYLRHQQTTRREAMNQVPAKQEVLV